MPKTVETVVYQRLLLGTGLKPGENEKAKTNIVTQLFAISG